MAERSPKKPAANWLRRVVYHQEGTYLAVEQDALGTWFAFDTRNPGLRVSGPFFRLDEAQVGAERLVATDTKRYLVSSEA